MKVQGKSVSEAKAHETGIVRNVNATKELPTVLDNETRTLYDLLANAVKRYGDKHAVGYRDLVKEHVEEKMITKVVNNEKTEIPKKWSYFELSDYKYLSFNQFYEKTMRLAGGLRKLGLKAGDKLELYASTTACWFMMAHAAMSQSMSIITAYETLGEEGLLHSLRETGVQAIYTEANHLKSLVNPLKEVNLHYIIYRGEANPEDIEALKQSRSDIKLISYEELESASEPAAPEPPSPEDLCCTMYTSGSTGLPKGVLLTHKNMVALVTGVCKVIPEVTSRDYLLAYLPLAHILEFAFENLCLAWGGTIGYAGVRTLTDASCRNCHGDILSFKPTIMVGVPAVWEMVRKGITSKLGAASSVKRSVFWAAYHAKIRMMRHGIPGSSFFDAAVFNKIRSAGTGGRLRYVLSGGSALSPDTKQFLSVVLCPVLIGYGLTEVSAAAMIETPSTFNIDDSAGVILPCTELKLIDCEEGSYYTNSNPPRGEILLRGPSLTQGYLNRKQENKESFSEDGWFMTGDVGELTPHGLLRIIDRKKNLVKTQNGEYIALEKLESRYRSSSLVANICVYADQSKVKPIAVIVPNEAAVHKLAVEKAGVDDSTSWESVCKNKKVRHMVLEDLLKIGRSHRFSNIELLQNVVLVPIEFTSENGLVTAAQKLQRRKIVEHFSKDVNEAYAE